MDRSDIRTVIASRVARELHDGDFVNLGIGLPTLVANHVRPDIEVWLQSENGMLGIGPFPTEDAVDADLINAGKQTVTLTPLDGFSSVVLTAGAYDELDQFVFGAYVNDAGEAQDPYSNAGKLHGSDFLVHDIELEVPVIGLPLDHGF